MHILERLAQSFLKHCNHIAIESDGVQLSYYQLLQSALLIENEIKKYAIKKNPVCLIISKKSLLLYQSLLACFLGNFIYTPMNVDTSFNRNKQIIEIADPDIVIVGECDEDVLNQLLPYLKNKTILVFDYHFTQTTLNLHSQNKIIYLSIDKAMCLNHNKIECGYSNDIAYLFFTSGSTGTPKGVPISYHNLSAYFDSIFSLFRFTESDRVMQLCDIGFDLSLHEILISFCAGATLYVYHPSHASTLSHFVNQYKITHGFFVPSSIPTLKKQSEVLHFALTSLRKVFVCGEIFPLLYAEWISAIAPHAEIVNLYGPTETTIACTYHFYRPHHDYHHLHSVPIGFPFPSVLLRLSDSSELLIEGKQVFSGYWKSQEKPILQYQTGDIVHFDDRWGYIYRSRKDDQWQIHAYRVEKNEVEAAVRSVVQCNDIYVSPVFNHHHLIDELIAFSTEHIDMHHYERQLQLFLMPSAIPKKCITIPDIPKLSNGKIDYRVLSHMIFQNRARSDSVASGSHISG